MPAAGFSSTQALDALEATAREVLPPDMSFDWADMSYQERRAPGVAVVFALAIFLVFLDPGRAVRELGPAVQRAARHAVRGVRRLPRALAGAHVHGPELREQRVRADRPDHADRPGGEERDPDRRVREDGARARASRSSRRRCSAAKLRFRPILMTAFAFILGVVPLLTATGAGAEGAQGDGHGGVLRACSSRRSSACC